ncbi:MAG: hypothetical protein MUF71_00625 [Candidatus Kapabacteria bacterium]|nr:hypothetical protein [Candidatus Kapabacteria bacterium]
MPHLIALLLEIVETPAITTTPNLPSKQDDNKHLANRLKRIGAWFVGCGDIV